MEVDLVKGPRCACGADILDPATKCIFYPDGRVKCGACGKVSIIRKMIVVRPLLEFECNEFHSKPIEIKGDVTIGRDQKDGDYIKVWGIIEENTLIRNLYVSKEEHIKIFVTPYYEFKDNKFIEKKKCILENLSLRFGTEVNGTLLKPGEKKELKNNDKIVLAPRIKPDDIHSPVIIIFKEELSEAPSEIPKV